MYLRQNKNTARKTNSVKLAEKKPIQHFNPISKHSSLPFAHALTVRYSSQNLDTTVSQGTVQLLRKRVKGNSLSLPTPINQSDIFYDKKTGQYYGGMCIENLNWRGIEFSEEEQADYEQAKGKYRSAHTILLPESTSGRFIWNPVKTGDRQQGGKTFPLYRGCLVSSGERVSDPPSVRLYSEGNMDHAGVLADTMTTLDKFQDFLSLGQDPETHGRMRAARVEKAPLIKATEFDTRDRVIMRYATSSSNKNSLFKLGRELAALKNAALKENIDINLETYKDNICKLLSDLYEHNKERLTKINKADLTNHTEGFLLNIINKVRSDINIVINENTLIASFRELFNLDSNISIGFPKNGPHMSLINGFNSTDGEHWNDADRRLTEKEEKEHLEISYGGSTGDMGHVSERQGKKRQYDLIQSTFFWLPNDTTEKNAEIMASFMSNKFEKLKPGGVVRVVSLAGNAASGIKNQYKTAADQAIAKVEKDKRFIDVKTIYLKKNDHAAQYEALLHDKEMNPEQDSEHHSLTYRRLWTETRKPVADSEEGDLILQAKRPPETASQPPSSLKQRSNGLYTGSPFHKPKPHVPDPSSLSSSITITKLG